VSVEGANPVVLAKSHIPAATPPSFFVIAPSIRYRKNSQNYISKEWADKSAVRACGCAISRCRWRQSDSATGGRPAVQPGMAALPPRSGDDKAPIAAMLPARRNPARKLRPDRTSNSHSKARKKPVAEPGEDATANKEPSPADLWLMCDGPVYQTRRQQIVFGGTRRYGLISRSTARGMSCQRPLWKTGRRIRR